MKLLARCWLPLFSFVLYGVLSDLDEDEMIRIGRKDQNWMALLNTDQGLDTFFYNSMLDCRVPEMPVLPAKEKYLAYLGKVHVIYGCDAHSFGGLLSSMLSLSRHLADPGGCSIHVVVPGHQLAAARRLRECFLQDLAGLPARPSVLLHRLLMHGVNASRARRPPVTFVKWYVHQYLPDVPRAVYLDADTIVRADIATLYRMRMKLPLAATYDVGLWQTPRRNPAYQSPAVIEELLSQDLPLANSGLLVLDLRFWRTGELSKLMEKMADRFPDVVEDQVGLNLVIQGVFEEIDWRWNLPGLCLGFRFPAPCLSEAKILHFNGVGKPWRNDGLCWIHGDLFESHYTHGECWNA